MVAKINKGASLFGAISYNQEKVDSNEATILFSQGIIHNEKMEYNVKDCLWSFDALLSANKRTEKPVVHISLNPDPRDMVDDDTARDIAKTYLEKLGYGEQPYLLYKHNDIERMHYHIVTVCVDENGAKIKSGYEKRRSMQACREIEKKFNLHIATKAELKRELRIKKIDHQKGELTKQIRNTVGALINDYDVSSFSEYRTLLEQFGCTYTHVDGQIEGKPIHGIFYSSIDEKGKKNSRPLKSSLFGKEYGYDELNKTFLKNKKRMNEAQVDFTRKTITQCMHQCRTRSKEEFSAILKKRGIDLVLHENQENKLYGVTYIDHNCRTVINGSRIGKEFAANYLSNFFDNPHFIIPHFNMNKNFEHTPTKEKDVPEEQAFQSIDSLFSLPEGTDQDDLDNLKRKKKKRGLRF